MVLPLTLVVPSASTSYGATPVPRNSALPYVPAPYCVHVPRVNVWVEGGLEIDDVVSGDDGGGDDAGALVLVVGVVTGVAPCPEVPELVVVVPVDWEVGA